MGPEAKRSELIYEGKAKKLYKTDDPNLLVQEFKDDATAFGATKHGIINQKGVINNRISEIVFKLLESKGVATHFVQRLSPREMLIKKVKVIPLEITIRNIVAGGMAKLLGLEEGLILKEPVLEYHYKEDNLHDPMINEYHIKALGLANTADLKVINSVSFQINNILKSFFDRKHLILVDFKLEFGKHKGKILLGDEVSPDTCRLWDKTTKEKLDKDRFRMDLGGVEDAYHEVLRRLEVGN
ncbi:MAG: phosphoribosylaminoimidazolesuccinocarboxamide synthase [Candidatus Omnitrophica bacterium CG07_land_8_20_14_0_80_42_15]|uniref:Phosphoribosylaminoimidazole-succinocarboxamide synthase n=1 Tax=Candidatus Aquitaenariimonas noxiae TaxID=1974741 RepID=A0A2J0KV16_9BACT|nr:MAG: phosphoribosylaminoimidazolesuccinocarboxamide synthase [Candidatus Omnitrophica bacterium CG07_land_8_20_14_0_80_42_15]